MSLIVNYPLFKRFEHRKWQRCEDIYFPDEACDARDFSAVLRCRLRCQVGSNHQGMAQHHAAPAAFYWRDFGRIWRVTLAPV